MGLIGLLTFLGVGAGTAATIASVVTWAVTLTTLAVGIKGYRQLKDMQQQGQAILANKTSAGGKIPVIYGTRRVGAQIIYMDTNNNDSRDLYVVYALAVGECEEIVKRSIELDGAPITDSARFFEGGYVGSDAISSGAGSVNTASQNGDKEINAGAGQFGTDPTKRYMYVLNCHHGAASQTADPMLVASMTNWTSDHRLDGICYIAAHFQYETTGMWSGVPQLTAQVRGKKVYDPRKDSTEGGSGSHRFNDPSTYEWSDNPALCFLDYISNNEYGKGLTASQLNLTTFSSAANTADALQYNPYYNGTAKSITFSGTSGDNFITITAGVSGGLQWWQNKIGELFTLADSGGNIVINSKPIYYVSREYYYGQPVFLKIYFAGTLGATYTNETGTSLAAVRRFHCNGYLDTNKNVMDNAKELLSSMRGIFLYINGQYELQIEDTGTSTFSITDDHIIDDAGISIDYGNKDKKANKVVIEFFNANKDYELDTATVLHDASPEYYSDDNDEILEIKAEFPYISDPYIAYNMGKGILLRSRNQTTLQFLGTPEMYKLNVGDIVDLTYSGLGISSANNNDEYRVEALELQPNGLVVVSLIEYIDIYSWQSAPQEDFEELAALPTAYAVDAPANLAFTDTNASNIGRPKLTWDEPTDYPSKEFRVDVVDSSSNNVFSKIVDTNSADLAFIPKATGYVASVSGINTLGVESTPATLPFDVSDEPTKNADIQNNTIVVNDKVTADSIGAVKGATGTFSATNFTLGGAISSFYTYQLRNSDSTTGDLSSLLSTPITITVPATATATTQQFIATVDMSPTGSPAGAGADSTYLTIGMSTSSSATTVWTTGESYEYYGLHIPLSVSIIFSITTSTSASVTRYVHAYAGALDLSGSFKATVTVEGLYR